MDTNTSAPATPSTAAVAAALKPGFKTTEFWLKTVAVIGGLVVASGAFPDTSPVAKIVALIVSGLSAMGYSSQRAELKQTALAQ